MKINFRKIRKVMALLFAFGSLLGLLACYQPIDGSFPSSHIGQKTQAIIGGIPDSRHPAVGALTSSGRSFCTGTLIAKSVVLTAAHCIDAARNYARSPQVKLMFRVEIKDLTNVKGIRFESYEFDKKLLLVHPKWDKNVSKGNDVGIAILKQKLQTVKIIPYNKAPLDKPDPRQWHGKKVLFLGYGLIQSTPTAKSASQKYGVEIPIVKMLRDRFEHRAPKKSVCHGDSGGPALAIVNGRLVTIGVNSYVTAPRVQGTNRSSCTASGFSMRTDTYQFFIGNLLSKYGDGPETCKKNSDCGACEQCNSLKKYCQPKPFQAATTSCQSCTKDGDCGSGTCLRTLYGYRCMQTCSASGCCPQGYRCTPRKQKGSLCLPKDSICPDISCTTDQDCGLGEFCNQKACRPKLPPPSPKLCHPCKIHTDCAVPNALCFGPKQNKQCLQPCAAADFCPSGFQCKLLYPGAPKQCVPINNSCQIPCSHDKNCPNDFACKKTKDKKNGYCERKGGGSFADTCDPMTCKNPFVCTKTLSGKRCLQPCDGANGYAGGLCKANKCADKSSCFPFGNGIRICVNRCKSTQDCKNLGGGSCSRGVCFCQGSKQCNLGFSCSFASGYFGSCVTSSVYKSCPKAQECRSFSEGRFCVEKGGGIRSLGERCDSLNRCSKGLACLAADDGPRCVEDCDLGKRQCTLGGSCRQLSRSLFICSCKSNSDCPKDRECSITLYQGRVGYCIRRNPLSSQCQGDAECPPAHKCVQGKCHPKTLEPSTEVTKEQAKEKHSEAIKTESTIESTIEENPTTDTTEPSNDAGSNPEKKKTGNPDAKPELHKVHLGGGCGCQESSTPPPLSGLLLLLLIVPILYRKHRNMV